MSQRTKTKNRHKASHTSPSQNRATDTERPGSFEATYPAIAQWVMSYGWIEVGQDDFSRSMVRALDIGGMVWEGKRKYNTVDDLWKDLEKGLIKCIDEIG